MNCFPHASSARRRQLILNDRSTRTCLAGVNDERAKRRRDDVRTRRRALSLAITRTNCIQHANVQPAGHLLAAVPYVEKADQIGDIRLSDLSLARRSVAEIQANEQLSVAYSGKSF